jgi:hypothetical protein
MITTINILNSIDQNLYYDYFQLCCKDLELATLSCFHFNVLKSMKMYIIPMFDNYPTFF